MLLNYHQALRAFGILVCWVIEAFNSELVCNLPAEDLMVCCLATISEFVFSHKLFMVL